MSASRHIIVQVRIYKKPDINLGTYLKHTKTKTNKPASAKTTYKLLKQQKIRNKKDEKNQKKHLYNKQTQINETLTLGLLHNRQHLGELSEIV